MWRLLCASPRPSRTQTTMTKWAQQTPRIARSECGRLCCAAGYSNETIHGTIPKPFSLRFESESPTRQRQETKQTVKRTAWLSQLLLFETKRPRRNEPTHMRRNWQNSSSCTYSRTKRMHGQHFRPPLAVGRSTQISCSEFQLNFPIHIWTFWNRIWLLNGLIKKMSMLHNQLQWKPQQTTDKKNFHGRKCWVRRETDRDRKKWTQGQCRNEWRFEWNFTIDDQHNWFYDHFHFDEENKLQMPLVSGGDRS